EFFAGIGLMRVALEKQGWTAAYANDIDAKKLEMYRTQFDGGVGLRDIHSISASEISDVALAPAAFPCDDLSRAGARAGVAGEPAGMAGKQSGAFGGLVRILEGMGSRGPPMALVENVPGFLTSHGGRDFERALEALNELGYDVDAFVLDAVHFVPQSRQRLF